MNIICSDDRSKLLTPNLKAELCVKVDYDLKCSQLYENIKNNDKILNAWKSNAKYTSSCRGLEGVLAQQSVYLVVIVVAISMPNLYSEKLKKNNNLKF